MKAGTFLGMLVMPNILASMILIIATFAAYWIAAGEDGGHGALVILGLLDLREHGTIAAWFKVVLYLECSLAFFLIGLNGTGIAAVPRHVFSAMKLLSGLLVLASIETMLSLHTLLDIRVVNLLGIESVTFREDAAPLWATLLLTAVLIAAAGFVLTGLFRLAWQVPSGRRARKTALTLLGTALGAVILAALFEGIQGYLWYRDIQVTIASCFEESLELTALCSLFALGVRLADEYRF